MAPSRSYKIQDFARLTGVTVKALHHYDRLGLLVAKRTDTGYRAYFEADLERLEQIVALKYLGLSLQQIKTLLDRTPLALPSALRTQRIALERRQLLLERAIRAIHAAELSLKPGEPVDSGLLRTIIEVINMQEGVEAMKKYYNEAGWTLRQRYYETGPAPEWLALYRDANALLKADPASAGAQAVADRWLELSVRAYRGDPTVQTDSPMAWADRNHWPEIMKQRVAELHLEEVTDFMQRVALHARRKYFTESSWARFLDLRHRAAAASPGVISRVWQAHVDLFRDAANTGRKQPPEQATRLLVERWIAILEAESDSDAEVLSSLMAAWSDWTRWPAILRWQMEGLAMLSGEDFNIATGYLVDAMEALNRKTH